MLGVSFGAADPHGIALALAAGTAAAANAVWFARTVRHVDNVVATLHMTVAAMVSVCAVALVNGQLQLPHGAAGWAGFWAVVALQSLGAPVYFAAIRRIGAVKSGMISNIQPLVSILAAFALFGELLSAAQLAGGAMILCGIVLMQRHDAARAALRRR
jgi:DME family drug/metabolite transporter